jgi:glycosyltransferase involved in cell wall biosynthesis
VRLFFIVENDEPHAAGGGFYALHKFAEFLVRRGHEVCVYGVHDMHWVEPGNGLSFRFRPSLPRRGRLLSRLDRMLSRLSARLLLEPAVRRFRPDWICGVLTYSAIKAEALGRKSGVPVANFIYECPPWMEEVWGAETFRRGYDKWTERLWEETRRAYLGSRVLLPNSDLSRRHNSRWLGGKEVGEPIHPGIDPEQMPIKAPAREPMALDPGRKHLLCVGRLIGSKNVRDLISAFPFLHGQAELHVCGTGSEMAALKAQAAGLPQIRFHGFVSDDLLWSLFRQCDLVVYPTGFEGFGMPPMQALYFGKPCLASDLEIFRSVYGDLLEYFPLSDVKALASSIDRLLADPDYRRRRGEAGRRHVLENFTWARAAERIEHQLMKATA